MLRNGDHLSILSISYQPHLPSERTSHRSPYGFGLDLTGAPKNKVLRGGNNVRLTMHLDGDTQAAVLKLTVFITHSAGEEMGQLLSVGGLCKRSFSYSHVG